EHVSHGLRQKLRQVGLVRILNMQSVVKIGSGRRLAPGLWAALLTAGLGAAPAPAPAASPAANHDKPAAQAEPLFGDYLAGRHAQQHRDFGGAAKWFEKAIATDPDAPELISRTFLMEIGTGHFDRALALAGKELKLDPGDAMAELVLVVDRLKAGDPAGAIKHAAALPSEGVHRFIGPFA